MDEAQLPERLRRAGWERLYATEAEPFTYSARAAEVLRHEHVQKTVRGLRPRHGRVLDMGCSVGQLTSRLVGLADTVQGMDVSATAVVRARAACTAAGAYSPRAQATRFHLCVGSSLEAPFRDQSFDLVLMCDGLHSWRMTPDEQRRALEEAHRLLVPGGLALLTEHLKPRHFDGFITRVRDSPLQIESVRYLHNRLWYSLERGLWRFRHSRPVGRLLASRAVAKGLIVLSSLAGRRGAKHLCLIARRAPRDRAAS